MMMNYGTAALCEIVLGESMFILAMLGFMLVMGLLASVGILIAAGLTILLELALNWLEDLF